MTRDWACRVAAAALLALSACGDGGPLRSDDPIALRTEVVIARAPAGLETAVVVDSVVWEPALALPTTDADAVEVEGPYRFRVRNDATRAVALLFDLRFYDEGDLFVDNWTHSGVPTRLAAGATGRIDGRFLLRAPLRVGRFGLRRMEIAVRIDTVAGG